MYQFLIIAYLFTLYLLLKGTVYDGDDEPFQIYFKCYKLNDNRTWSALFITPSLDTTTGWGNVCAAISSKCDEMIIAYHNGDQLAVFIADVGIEIPSVVLLNRFPTNIKTWTMCI